MPKFRLTTFLVIVVFLVSACEKPQMTAEKSALALSRIPCRYQAHEQVSIACYVAHRKDGVNHSYHVSVLSLKTGKNTGAVESELRANEAVLAIPGGPGQGEQTKDGWIASWVDFVAKNAISYDVIVFDPPGTIGSSSYWRCEDYERQVVQLAAQNIRFREETLKLAPTMNACLERYHSHLIDHNFSSEGLLAFSSRRYVERLSLLMRALDYDGYHLLATSYGTRVALLLAQDPLVATLTLDSAYPFSRGTLLDTPALLEKAVHLHRRHYSDFIDDGSTYDEALSAGLAELQQRPQPWRLERWDGHEDMHFVLNANRLQDLAFSVLYDESMLGYFYAGLQNVKNKPAELRWVLEDFVTSAFDPAFSTLTFIATECSDNQRVRLDVLLDEAEKYPDIDEDWRLIFEQDSCAHPLFNEAPYLQQEAYTDKPTLVFAGELDPVTPTFWVEELLENLPRVQVLTLANVGHAVLGSERCDIADLIQFWQSRDEAVEVHCE